MRKYAVATVVSTLRAHHGLLSLAADALGCSRSTVYRYVEAYPEVAAVVAEERERLVDMAEDALYSHVEEKAPWAIALVLKTLGRRRGYEDKAPMVSTPDTGEAQEWQVIQTALFQALQAYPEARWAVVQALGAHTREFANGHHSSVGPGGVVAVDLSHDS
jgi:hypothetical protein